MTECGCPFNTENDPMGRCILPLLHRGSHFYTPVYSELKGSDMAITDRKSQTIVDQQQAEKKVSRHVAMPLFSGCIQYFPDALLAVAECSRIATQQHHPDKPMHWDRAKSPDELNALASHLLNVGKIDSDNVRHSTKVAWRALANLQKEIEKERAVEVAKADYVKPLMDPENTAPFTGEGAEEALLAAIDKIDVEGSFDWEKIKKAHHTLAVKLGTEKRGPPESKEEIKLRAAGWEAAEFWREHKRCASCGKGEYERHLLDCPYTDII